MKMKTEKKKKIVEILVHVELDNANSLLGASLLIIKNRRRAEATIHGS